ncbi:MAG: periplasmic nitrate reductase, NapE protein [Gammaproteobacteria bacterium]|jgi:nitrate reductase NapE
MSATEEVLPAKKQELTLFLILTVVVAPVVSLSIIGGYGLFIWLSQIIGGPPTH